VAGAGIRRRRGSGRAGPLRAQAHANSAPIARAEPLSAAMKIVPLAFILRKVACTLSSWRSVLSRVRWAIEFTPGILLIAVAKRDTTRPRRVLICGNPTPPCCSQVTSAWLRKRSGCAPVKTTARMFGSLSARSTSSLSCWAISGSNRACGPPSMRARSTWPCGSMSMRPPVGACAPVFWLAVEVLISPSPS
jgi:hypothetical protein